MASYNRITFLYQQLKRKRVGAGLRGSSTLFQSASEFLKTSKNESLASQELLDHAVDDQEEKPDKKRSKTFSDSVSTSKAAASSSSPSKKCNKTLSKKQQKLAEAAKDSHCISDYFGKKLVNSTQKQEPEESETFTETAQDECKVSGVTSGLKSDPDMIRSETKDEIIMGDENTVGISSSLENRLLNDRTMDVRIGPDETRESRTNQQNEW